MVCQCGLNGLAVKIEWFGSVNQIVCNIDRMVLQSGSNGFVTQIDNASSDIVIIVGFRIFLSLPLHIIFPRPLVRPASTVCPPQINRMLS